MRGGYDCTRLPEGCAGKEVADARREWKRNGDGLFPFPKKAAETEAESEVEDPDATPTALASNLDADSQGPIQSRASTTTEQNTPLNPDPLAAAPGQQGPAFDRWPPRGMSVTAGVLQRWYNTKRQASATLSSKLGKSSSSNEARVSTTNNQVPLPQQYPQVTSQTGGYARQTPERQDQNNPTSEPVNRYQHGQGGIQGGRGRGGY